MKDYLEMIKTFNLQNDGLILSYLYSRLDDKLLDTNYHFDKFDDSEAGVLVYQKDFIKNKHFYH